MSETEKAPLFQDECQMLGEIHRSVVEALKKAKLDSAPAAARICLDNLAVANMCLQQLSFMLTHEAELKDAAVQAALSKFGKPAE